MPLEHPIPLTAQEERLEGASPHPQPSSSPCACVRCPWEKTALWNLLMTKSSLGATTDGIPKPSRSFLAPQPSQDAGEGPSLPLPPNVISGGCCCLARHSESQDPRAVAGGLRESHPYLSCLVQVVSLWGASCPHNCFGWAGLGWRNLLLRPQAALTLPTWGCPLLSVAIFGPALFCPWVEQGGSGRIVPHWFPCSGGIYCPTLLGTKKENYAPLNLAFHFDSPTTPISLSIWLSRQ